VADNLGCKLGKGENGVDASYSRSLGPVGVLPPRPPRDLSEVVSL
jgi:hypothetical protein